MIYDEIKNKFILQENSSIYPVLKLHLIDVFRNVK